jgi:hypothetical protein
MAWSLESCSDQAKSPNHGPDHLAAGCIAIYTWIKGCSPGVALDPPLDMPHGRMHYCMLSTVIGTSGFFSF